MPASKDNVCVVDEWCTVLTDVELTLLNPDVVSSEGYITNIFSESKSAVDQDRVEFWWVGDIEKHVPGRLDVDIITCLWNSSSFPRKRIAPESVFFLQEETIDKLWYWALSFDATKTLDSQFVSLWALSVDNEVEFSSVVTVWVSSVEGILTRFK